MFQDLLNFFWNFCEIFWLKKFLIEIFKDFKETCNEFQRLPKIFFDLRKNVIQNYARQIFKIP